MLSTTLVTAANPTASILRQLNPRQNSSLVPGSLCGEDHSAEKDALAPQPVPRVKRADSIIHTDFFVTEIRSLGLAQGGPSASLSWHCLAMTDLLAGPPQIVVVADRKPSVDGKVTGENVYWDAGLKGDEWIPRDECAEENVRQDRSEEIAELEKRLLKAEKEAEEAKKVAQQKERLIADLKAQLDESTTACKDLLETLKEQEDTIEKLA